jgi:hypothetical protein
MFQIIEQILILNSNKNKENFSNQINYYVDRDKSYIQFIISLSLFNNNSI